MSQQLILFFHLILCFCIIGLVLIQHGKGADAGAAFGSGASGTVFGSQGSGTFLTKITTLTAVLFAVTSIMLSIMAKQKTSEISITDMLTTPVAQEETIDESDTVPQAPE